MRSISRHGGLVPLSDQDVLWLAHCTTDSGLRLNLPIWHPDVRHKLKVSGFGAISAGYSRPFPVGQDVGTAGPELSLHEQVHCRVWELVLTLSP